MTPISPLVRTSPTFKSDLDQYFAVAIPLLSTEVAAAQTDITTKQGIASSAATAAASAAGTAVAAAIQTGLDRTQTGLDAGSAHADALAASASAASALSSANSMLTLTAGGTVDVVTVATPGAVWALTDGRAMLVKFIGLNTISGVTVGVDATTVKPLRRGSNQPLQVGDTAGSGLIRYNTASGGYYELMNPGVAISLDTQITYANASTLRTYGTQGMSAFVADLGRFTFVARATTADEDDGETCFLATGGAWELRAVDPEYLEVRGQALAGDAVDDVVASKFLYATFAMTSAGLTTLASVSFTVSMPGVIAGDVATVNTSTVPSIASVTAKTQTDSVVVTIANPSAGTISYTAGTWAVSVTKQ